MSSRGLPPLPCGPPATRACTMGGSLTIPPQSHPPAAPADLWRDEVSVLVMNNAPREHAEFEELRRGAAAGTDRFSEKARHYVSWLENPGTVTDPTPDAADPDDLHNPGDRPGRCPAASLSGWSLPACPRPAPCACSGNPCPARHRPSTRTLAMQAGEEADVRSHHPPPPRRPALPLLLLHGGRWRCVEWQLAEL